ncbi:barstar family protein [Mycolicibacterium llatzerense]|uniref:Ribonuclease inhibitor n=1 Tax=Mycolicibacterium llatzerense TaxID=280871 RepID=A0A0D1LHB2_9MYCO|nr:barstar family protein [Mycolicibacterium llatzerense]KIU15426.1 ribonuclease inhibitor [Mycolicibacterium llatzerense]MCT7369353.1 ribonuclease inhibitor [Mycolicibacterium llatzerense]
MKTFTVRGARIHSRADLFTELGHAVNGTDGYFGSNLDALADCLGGGFGTPDDEPFRFVLTDSSKAKKALDSATWTGLLDVFDSAGIDLMLR